MDGRPVALASPKLRLLLAALLLNPGQAVSTDRLVDVLWSESPPRTAITSLQNFVAQLRKLIGADAIVTRPPGYALRVDADQVDASVFERLLTEARGAEAATRADLLRRGLALWRGPALADFAYDAFAETEAGRLEELRLVALEERIDADLALERHAEVVPELEGLVARHPLRERFRGQLMLALYRSGRQAEALRAYQRARETLVEELGIDPSPELQRLHASILRQESSLVVARADDDLDHLDELLRALLAGRLVPVLGAAATGEGGTEPPRPSAVAERLAAAFGYGDGVVELPRVSQYVATLTGPGPLYDELHDVFAAEYRPGCVHRLLARLPPILRARGAQHQLVVTTGYDLALEQAFTEAGEEFDVVAYLASGPNRGRFCHVAPGASPAVIAVPNTYAAELSLERRTIILKIHGQVDVTESRDWESFVVTEDDYIDFLAQSEIAAVVPVSLVAKLRRSHFLFLGYALRDWNLRVILNRLWGDEKITYRSWAVQPATPSVERAFWRRRDVEVIESELDAYVGALGKRLDEAA